MLKKWRIWLKSKCTPKKSKCTLKKVIVRLKKKLLNRKSVFTARQKFNLWLITSNASTRIVPVNRTCELDLKKRMPNSNQEAFSLNSAHSFFFSKVCNKYQRSKAEPLRRTSGECRDQKWIRQSQGDRAPTSPPQGVLHAQRFRQYDSQAKGVHAWLQRERAAHEGARRNRLEEQQLQARQESTRESARGSDL